MSGNNDKLLKILFKNTGSTTAVLEAIAGENVRVEIIKEDKFQDTMLSDKFNWEQQLVLRITILKSRNSKLSYNVVVYDPSKLNIFKERFEKLDYPIGNLLECVDYQRTITYTGWKDTKHLSKYFNFEKLDGIKYPIKEYLHSHDGQILFYISEIYNIDTIAKLFNTK